MVKQLSERATRARPPRLLPIDRVERLVHEQSDGERKVQPSRRALLHRRCAHKKTRGPSAARSPLPHVLEQRAEEDAPEAVPFENQVEGFQNVEADGAVVSGRKSGSHEPPLETWSGFVPHERVGLKYSSVRKFKTTQSSPCGPRGAVRGASAV